MTTTYLRAAFCTLFLATLPGAIGRAAEPPTPTAPRTKGRVLILDGDRTLDGMIRTLEGDIERHGDQYRLRRSVGETWIPGDKAVRLCASYEDAYAFLRTQANLSDPDVRLQLARWCNLHNLREQAVAEVAAAVDLRPDPDTKRLLASLQKASLVAGQPAKPRDDESHVPPAPVEVTTESVSLFTTKVQPILMNACASCHASGRGGAFRLTRSFEAGSRRTTQMNLAAVIHQVTPTNPAASPILVKAISTHGDLNHPPLKGKQLTAYKTLEDWVLLTAASMPQVAAAPREAVPFAAAAAEPKTSGEFAVLKGEKPEAKPAPAREPAPAKVIDEFDPEVFNRQTKK